MSLHWLGVFESEMITGHNVTVVTHTRTQPFIVMDGFQVNREFFELLRRENLKSDPLNEDEVVTDESSMETSEKVVKRLNDKNYLFVPRINLEEDDKNDSSESGPEITDQGKGLDSNEEIGSRFQLNRKAPSPVTFKPESTAAGITEETTDPPLTTTSPRDDRRGTETVEPADNAETTDSSKPTEAQTTAQTETPTKGWISPKAHGGLWGNWGSVRTCHQGEHVIGVQLSIEGQQGRGDDTALNAIRLRCSDGTVLKSSEMNSGSWLEEVKISKSDYWTGASIRQEKPQGGGDDTSANGIRLFSAKTNVITKPGDGYWGDWSSFVYCPGGTRISGFKTRVESAQGGGDDTALNDVSFFCSIPTEAPTTTEETTTTTEATTQKDTETTEEDNVSKEEDKVTTIGKNVTNEDKVTTKRDYVTTEDKVTTTTEEDNITTEEDNTTEGRENETSTKNSEEPTVDDTTAEAIAKELTEFTTESQTEMSTQNPKEFTQTQNRRRVVRRKHKTVVKTTRVKTRRNGSSDEDSKTVRKKDASTTLKLDDSNEHETTSSIVIDHDSNENIDNGDKFVDDEYKYAGGYDYNGGKSRILVIS